MIVYTEAGRPGEIAFWHTSRKMIVAHDIPLTDIHRFKAFEEKQAIVEQSLHALKIAQHSELGCPDGQIAIERINAAQDAIKAGDLENAANLFASNGLDDSTAQSLLDALVDLRNSASVVYFEHDKGKINHHEGFALLQSGDTLWLLQPIDEPSDSSVMYLRSIATSEIEARIQAMVDRIPISGC